MQNVRRAGIAALGLAVGLFATAPTASAQTTRFAPGFAPAPVPMEMWEAKGGHGHGWGAGHGWKRHGWNRGLHRGWRHSRHWGARRKWGY